MSQAELKRVLVLQRVLDGRMSIQEASLVLGLSERHIKRLKAKLRLHGPGALAHGNRGRKPAHAIPDDLRAQVLHLAQTRYGGCNYTFLSELLAEREGILLSPSSVRRILQAAGIPSPRKHRPPKLHRRRPRKPQLGMLVLIDGSRHDWLEGRGPWLVLHAAVDDATGRILAANFRLAEDFEGYRRLLQDLVTQHGIPLAVYSDRHSLFVSPKADRPDTIEQQLLGQAAPPLSQLGRILNELGIEHIRARSPQAKGRIERCFGTLQERLTVELRLAGASTVEEANAVLQQFIPQYNGRFAVPPAEAEVAFRPVPAHLRLEHIFCWKEQRILNPGYTISYDGQTYRIVAPKGAPTIPLRSVIHVHRHADGSLSAAWQGHLYSLELFVDSPASRRSTQPERHERKEKAGATSSPRRPAANHPWRTRAVTPKPHCSTRGAVNNNTAVLTPAASGP